MALLVKNELRGGAETLASMEALFGIGVIAGGVLLGAWGGFKRRIFTSLLGLIGLGASIVALGVTPAEAVGIALVSALVAGAMQSMTNGPIGAVLQAVVAPEMMGRVMSLIGSLATAMTPLSLLVAGPVAEALGVRSWYIVGGLVCAAMGVIGFFVPAILHLEENYGQAAFRALERRVPGTLGQH